MLRRAFFRGAKTSYIVAPILLALRCGVYTGFVNESDLHASLTLISTGVDPRAFEHNIQALMDA
jgi:hypothetical protein